MKKEIADTHLKAIFDRLKAGTQTAEDVEKLWGLVSASRLVTQSGKYNIHVVEAKKVVVGDRTIYQGPDAEVIKQALEEVLDSRGLAPQPPKPQRKLDKGKDKDDQLKEYLEAVENDFHYLKILGMQYSKVEMNDLYIRLQLSGKYQHPQRRGLKFLFPSLRKKGTACMAEEGGNERELDINQAIQKYGHVVVIGDPGSGKTTSLHHVAYSGAKESMEQLAQGKKPSRVPVYIPLGGKNRGSKKVLKGCLNEVVKYYHLADTLVNQLEECIAEKRVILLFDGIDEVAESARKGVLGKLDGLMARFPETPMAVSSRIIGYEHMLPADMLEVQPLSDDKVRQFIDGWFKAIGKMELSELLWEKIKQDPKIKDMAGNPFLLSIIVLLYDKKRDLPKMRVELYQWCVGWLLEGLDQDIKQIDRNKFPKDFKEKMLARLAIHFFEKMATTKDTNKFPQKEVEAVVKEVIREEDETYPAKEVLEEIDFNSGLFRDIGGGFYDFPHRTIYEYFVARYLISPIPKSDPPLIGYLDRYYQDSQWVDVFRLAGGMLEAPAVDEFLEKAFDKDATLGALCYLDADPEQVDHRLAQEHWRKIERDERIKIVSGIRHRLSDQGQVISFMETICRTAEQDTEVLYHCDRVLAGLAAELKKTSMEEKISLAMKAESTSRRMFDWWPEERQFSRHKDAFEKDDYWKFIPIPGGTFEMGSDDGVKGEKPVHQVELSTFHLGQYPVTVGQYRRFDPGIEARIKEYDGREKFVQSEFQPVVDVTWFDAYIFGKWAGGRLPTEAEWEYACRAGTKTPYFWGGRFEEIDVYAWLGNNSEKCTHPVGQKEANLWGLYDMIGNVWEWCADWYGDYAPVAVTDPKGPLVGSIRVIRGGSWSFVARDCRSTVRLRGDPGYRVNDLGFRLASGRSQVELS